MNGLKTKINVEIHNKTRILLIQQKQKKNEAIFDRYLNKTITIIMLFRQKMKKYFD